MNNEQTKSWLDKLGSPSEWSISHWVVVIWIGLILLGMVIAPVISQVQKAVQKEREKRFGLGVSEKQLMKGLYEYFPIKKQNKYMTTFSSEGEDGFSIGYVGSPNNIEKTVFTCWIDQRYKRNKTVKFLKWVYKRQYPRFINHVFINEKKKYPVPYYNDGTDDYKHSKFQAKLEKAITEIRLKETIPYVIDFVHDGKLVTILWLKQINRLSIAIEKYIPKKEK